MLRGVKRIFVRATAELIFLIHTIWIAYLLVGWLTPPPYYYLYLALLVVTFATQFIWRYCLLTVWEFYFRKMLDPRIDGTEYYLTYYTHKFFPKLVTDEFVDRASLIFLALSIAFAALRLAGVL